MTLSTGAEVPVAGTRTETPPLQTLGGGLNSGISLITPVQIAPDASINVEFNLGVQQEGAFRFLVNVEALVASPVFGGEGTITTKSPVTKKSSASKAAITTRRSKR